MNNEYDVIIIGAGISGMTSAIYLKRYNINILLLEESIPGGQISKASLIENYPGIKKIDGVSFSMNLLEQINNLNIEIRYEKVNEIINEEEFKIVKTNNNKFISKKVIIATGRTPKKLLEKDEEYIGKGLSYCATCDGMLFKEKNVIVVGGGNSALEESLYLSNICKKVTIINRSNSLRADDILIKKIKEKDNVEILYNSSIKQIECDDQIKSVILNSDDKIECEGIFIYIGLIPNIPNIKNLKLENGYIVVDKNQMTNIDGIYAIGDVTKKDLYQLITAASEGAIAANHIKNNI